MFLLLPLKFIRAACILFCLLLISCLMTSCYSIPVQEQFVSAYKDVVEVRSTGACTELHINDSESRLESSKRELNPYKITVLDWNIFKGKRTGWQEDLLHLSENTDIVLLQEATNSRQLQILLDQRDMYWNFNGAFKYRGAETGVMIASLVQPVDSCGMREIEPLIGLPKTMLINRYAIRDSKETLLVANVHGINITLGISAYEKQFKKLQQILLTHSGPMVVAGDFNNWNEKRKAITDQLLESLSLSILSLENENRATFFGNPVDHVLYRGLKPFRQTSSAVTSSDHNPITVSFATLQN